MGNVAYIRKEDMTRLTFKRGARPLFMRMDIELTERCNNNCVHCYINLPKDDTAAKNKELSTDSLKDILKEAAGLGCLRVRFTGGEPLLRDDFEELYVFARKQGMGVIIFTNATLITPRLAGLLKRIPPLEKIEVSVYGMKKKSYEAVTRTPGSFERAWRGINLLLEHKIPFNVKNALLPYNEHEMDEFESWTAAIPWAGREPLYTIFFSLRARRDDEEKNRLIKTMRINLKDNLRILKRRESESMTEMRHLCSRSMRSRGDKIFSCGAGYGICCVDAYGMLQPCMMLRHPDCVYDLKKGSLNDAFKNFFPKIREMRSRNPAYLKRCARCRLKDLCGQCPARSWVECGTLDTPVEYLCEIARGQAGFLSRAAKGKKRVKINDRMKEEVLQ